MAGNQQAGTVPGFGTQTDFAGYERRGELKTVQQAERASGQEIHQNAFAAARYAASSACPPQPSALPKTGTVG